MAGVITAAIWMASLGISQSTDSWYVQNFSTSSKKTYQLSAYSSIHSQAKRNHQKSKNLSGFCKQGLTALGCMVRVHKLWECWSYSNFPIRGEEQVTFLLGGIKYCQAWIWRLGHLSNSITLTSQWLKTQFSLVFVLRMKLSPIKSMTALSLISVESVQPALVILSRVLFFFSVLAFLIVFFFF